MFVIWFEPCRKYDLVVILVVILVVYRAVRERSDRYLTSEY
jgi:hypothetical protein